MIRCMLAAVVLSGSLAGSLAAEKERKAVPPVSSPLPGMEAHPPELLARLAVALSAQGPQYRPRTRHRQENGAARYTNRLLLESSPYLLQHAHNPVNWFPWGSEAFETARRLGRPVLLSVGYSTCHWCHVMEEESFEDEEIAALLNARYIAVKVDREERPDVDGIYMKVVQGLSGHGGWPMTVWLDADGAPFFAGTYYPPRDGDRGARAGFLTLLGELARVYEAHPQQVARQAREIVDSLAARPAAGATALDPARTLTTALATWSSLHDERYGGLRGAPKFPSSLPLRLLLREWRRGGGTGRERDMAVRTLRALAGGGIRDQIGGGFHRYSVDERWLVPHFEKMLYDNALLVLSYLEAYQATGDAGLADVAEDTLRYLAREMSDPAGGFYSATDADSPTPEGHLEEGRFFTWTPEELRAVLAPPAVDLVASYYGVTPSGNLDGRSVLHVADELAASARRGGVALERAPQVLATARESLYRARAGRPAPARDDKILASWNGLAISAFARGAFVLDRAEHRLRAERAAEFVLAAMRRDGRLLRTYRAGGARLAAYLDDYAFLIAGLLDLFEASGSLHWFSEALALQAQLDRHYWDDASGGYFLTADDHERLLLREKPDWDGAEPCGNSVALLNLRRLYAFTFDERFRQRAERLLAWLAPEVGRRPTSLGETLLALSFELADPREIVIVAPHERDEAASLLAVVRRTYAPASVLVVVAAGELGRHAELLPALRGKVAEDGRPTAYVCRRGVCRRPVTEPAELGPLLVDAPEATRAKD